MATMSDSALGGIWHKQVDRLVRHLGLDKVDDLNGSVDNISDILAVGVLTETIFKLNYGTAWIDERDDTH